MDVFSLRDTGKPYQIRLGRPPADHSKARPPRDKQAEGTS